MNTALIQVTGPHIAVLEDNPDVLDDLLFNLEHRGFVVDGFAAGQIFDSALIAGCPWQVLVLDLGLPGEDGLSIARRLRKSHPQLGLIMLTARGSLADRIRGMTEGADIYLSKPVDMDELAACIHAVLRRVAPKKSEDTWVLDQSHQCLISPAGCKFDLSFYDYRIILVLAEAAGKPIKRDVLVACLEKNPNDYDYRALEMTISRLRKKLGGDAPVRAVRNKGYAFAAEIILQ